ncbi:MAG: ABC transporter substrate-binding protein [Bacteroidaceae bacterium]|nr:ABC transporter substrate-binding protein [Bacteroidaceae bacterium]
MRKLLPLIVVSFIFLHAVAAFGQRQSNVHIGVLLPFSGSETRTDKMVEFYRGVLMAVDSMSRKKGLNIEVTALDCGTSAEELDRVVGSNAGLKSCDFIIGPQAQSQVEGLTKFCRTNGIRLVVPFSNIPSKQSNENVYIVSTSGSERASQAALMFVSVFQGANVIQLTDVEGMESSTLTNAVVAQCAASGISVSRLSVKASLDEMRRVMSKSRRNVVVVGAGNLASINSVMSKLDEFTAASPDYGITVVGGFEWQKFVQQHLHNFYKYDVYMPATYYRNAINPANVQFENSYMRQFGVPMINTSPRFANMGFDIAKFFIQAVSDYGAEGTLLEENLGALSTAQRPLQHGLCFQWSGIGGWVNQSCRFVHYTTAHNIELLSR